MLKTQAISINYGVCEVVSEVTFDLAGGEIIAVLGANGAGKTTLLKSLNGALPISKGAILLDEKPLSAYSRREIARKIAVVAQETETKFPVTVLEFVLSGRFAHGGVFGWETAEDLQVADNSLKACDLDGYSNRLMNQLSGGERQRVVLARALATQAQTLLLDEPTANLDLAHQAMLLKLIRERCQTADSSAVVITHDLNLAAAFADKILLLKDSRIIAQGTPKEVLTTENLRAAFSIEVLLDKNPRSGNLRVTTIYD
jgi:iron complex transport system ATP-binding protein